MIRPQPRAKGQAYEAHACQYLVRHGLRVLDKNAHSRRGEIDLVMQDGTCLVFVEVRFRQGRGFGGAAASITAAKQKRLILAAERWMQCHGVKSTQTEFRFDAVTFDGSVEAVNWIKNIVQG
ncbi:YraN family protein [Salinivibrio kushneri]|uniref:UPF0102 protein BZG00_05700 n=1 Tax=Salinivibrio kushneri TaxID=1908198 RepID=A0AB36K0M0_9GAMM|nr:YraN family protein [Salinivibrio kushneri]OOE40323.1 YraN family protein [Salinivibrio kushneri]OOE70726.1 YraN family protein [Salinivibrio kushneri]QCP01286.1 YraN family protein [Salinivibrio kushneri]